MKSIITSIIIAFISTKVSGVLKPNDVLAEPLTQTLTASNLATFQQLNNENLEYDCSPQIIGNISVKVSQFSLAGSSNQQYLFAGGSLTGLYVYNVQQATPAQVGFVSGGINCVAKAHNSETLFTIGADGEFQVINVANPTAPQVIGQTYAGNTYGTVSDIAVTQNDKYAYVSFSIEESPIGPFPGFVGIVDISNPNSPQSVGNIVYNDPYPYSLGLSSNGSLLYIADFTQGLLVYDLTNPITPSKVGSLSWFASQAIAVTSTQDDKYIFIGDATNGLEIIQQSGKSYILVDTLSQFIGVQDLMIAPNGKILYVASIADLTLLDITNPASPAILSVVPLGSVGIWGNQFISSSNSDFIAYAFNNLLTINVSSCIQ